MSPLLFLVFLSLPLFLSVVFLPHLVYSLFISFSSYHIYQSMSRPLHHFLHIPPRTNFFFLIIFAVFSPQSPGRLFMDSVFSFLVSCTGIYGSESSKIHFDRHCRIFLSWSLFSSDQVH